MESPHGYYSVQILDGITEIIMDQINSGTFKLPKLVLGESRGSACSEKRDRTLAKEVALASKSGNLSRCTCSKSRPCCTDESASM